MRNFGEIIYTHEAHVACDGGQQGQGHPRIFLNCANTQYVTCPYCSQVFSRTQKQ